MIFHHSYCRGKFWLYLSSPSQVLLIIKTISKFKLVSLVAGEEPIPDSDPVSLLIKSINLLYLYILYSQEVIAQQLINYSHDYIMNSLFPWQGIELSKSQSMILAKELLRSFSTQSTATHLCDWEIILSRDFYRSIIP